MLGLRQRETCWAYVREKHVGPTSGRNMLGLRQRETCWAYVREKHVGCLTLHLKFLAASLRLYMFVVPAPAIGGVFISIQFEYFS